jgi:hypothetical protein
MHQFAVGVEKICAICFTVNQSRKEFNSPAWKDGVCRMYFTHKGDRNGIAQVDIMVGA